MLGEREMFEAVATLGNGNLSDGFALLYARHLSDNGKTVPAKRGRPPVNGGGHLRARVRRAAGRP